MNTSQVSTSTSNNDSDPRLYLDKKGISLLLKLAEKFEDIFSVGKEKIEEIYRDIDYNCKNNIGFNSVGTSKEIRKIEDIITKHRDIQEEISERLVREYIIKKGQSRIFEELLKYKEYLKVFERLKNIDIGPN